ncbi:MAG: AMP-binding protein, partial [Thermodesulfobacteriota bacterium]
MALENIYKEAMALNTTDDMDERREKAKAFFEKLNHMELPAHFNWAEEILEGLHVKERGDQPALVWADMDSGKERTLSYRELTEEGNRCLNYLRKNGITQGENMYMMIPIVPETWFATLACLKGGLINVPTATSMTVRELQFRFENYKPDSIVAAEAATDAIDEALTATGAKPKIKIVLGKKDGWVSYDDLAGEHGTAEGAKIKKDDVLICFFTSGTTG